MKPNNVIAAASLRRLALLTLLFVPTTDCIAASRTFGLDVSGFDQAVRAQDDLFRATNGRWLATTAIPADKAYAFGVEINDVTDRHVRAIVDDLASTTQQAGSVEQKIGAFYTSYLDTQAIDRAGLAPIRPLLAEIDAIRTRTQLAQWQGRAQGRLETPVLLKWVMPDFKDPTINRALTWQGGLGLPDRDYYLNQDDPRMAKARQAYAIYLTTVATLAGELHPADAAAKVIAIEHRIAQAHWAAADTRDPGKAYNPMTLEQLATQAPGFDWAAFVQAANLPTTEILTVTQPSATTAIARLFAELPLAQWKLYFKLHSLSEAAPVLPKAFRDAHFAFRGIALNGTAAVMPRWQRGIIEVNGALGEAVGQVYVARYFPVENKARVQVMVSNLLAAYRESIQANTWMTPATKQQALQKLSRYSTKIGYPDRWRDYAGLQVREGDALGNRHRARRFEWEHLAAKAGTRVDRSTWMMTPQTVNAYYDPMLNEVVFPAAYLQAPLFDMEADDAANYGALGATIGHEISHGFDTTGSQFDGQGVMRDWWAEADRKAFDAMSARLVAQYDGYEAMPGKHVNGRLTLAENIADVAGLQIAFKAYERSLEGKPAPVIQGLSGRQRFFLSYAQSRRAKMRDERLLQDLTNDPHAPPEFRTNGPVVNADGFHRAFDTRPGDGMFKPANERIRLW